MISHRDKLRQRIADAPFRLEDLCGLARMCIRVECEDLLLEICTKVTSFDPKEDEVYFIAIMFGLSSLVESEESEPSIFLLEMMRLAREGIFEQKHWALLRELKDGHKNEYPRNDMRWETAYPINYVRTLILIDCMRYETHIPTKAQRLSEVDYHLDKAIDPDRDDDPDIECIKKILDAAVEYNSEEGLLQRVIANRFLSEETAKVASQKILTT